MEQVRSALDDATMKERFQAPERRKIEAAHADAVKLTETSM